MRCLTASPTPASIRELGTDASTIALETDYSDEELDRAIAQLPSVTSLVARAGIGSGDAEVNVAVAEEREFRERGLLVEITDET